VTSAFGADALKLTNLLEATHKSFCHCQSAPRKRGVHDV